LLKKFRNYTIRVKLLCYFFAVVLLPITILGLFGNVIYTKSVEHEAENHTTQMIGQVKTNIEFHIKSMEDIIYYISKDPNVVESLQIKNSLDSKRVDLETKVRNILTNYTEKHKEIAGILIVNDNGFYVSNEIYRIARDPLTNEKWYKDAINHMGELRLISRPIGRNITTKNNYGANIISIVKAIRDPNNSEVKGVILIDIITDIIKDIINNVSFGKNGFVYIMDDNEEIVYSPINKIVYRVKASWLKNKQNIIKKIKGNNYQILTDKSNYTGWKIIGVFSLNETLSAVINMRHYTILIAIITLLIASCASLIFTSSIAKPVAELNNLMQKVKGGDLDVKFYSPYNDEISQLGNNFSDMVEEIQKLIDMVYVEQKSKRESELKMLQAQIKPHFLYNTLDTISWMAQKKEADDIVEIVNALTDLFRIGLSKGEEIITIGEEMKHIQSYLKIQKVRYDDKMDYQINYNKGIESYKILKLILQPIVENAIYHGIKQKRGKGLIVVNIYEEDDLVKIIITDSGAGLHQDQVQEIQEILDRGKAKQHYNGYGLFNVNERIKLTFGPQYGIHIYSKFGEGTKVEISHPRIKGEDSIICGKL
jgi:two-component system sensor histidine kinase YesM